MRLLLVYFLCVGLLCGCSDNKNDLSEFSGEKVTDISSQTEPEKTSSFKATASPDESSVSDSYEEHDAPLTFPVEENADPSEVAERYTFEVAEEGIWVYCEGKRAQLLDVNTDRLLRTDVPEDCLVHSDFNFDMYTDLFVPEIIGTPNIPGKYFRFNVKTGLFVIWQEMNEIGYLFNRNDEDETLTLTQRGSAIDHETTVYEWHDEALVKVRYKLQYEGDDGEVYIDNYTCADGHDELLYRERVLHGENGEWLGTEDVTIGDITNT